MQLQLFAVVSERSQERFNMYVLSAKGQLLNLCLPVTSSFISVTYSRLSLFITMLMNF